MTMDDKKVLVERVEHLMEDVTSIVAFLKQALIPEDKKTDIPAEEPAKVYTYEEARAVLAEKSRTGFRAEVKAILAKHGVEQLSDAKDPKVLAAIVAEAEEIKVG